MLCFILPELSIIIRIHSLLVLDITLEIYTLRIVGLSLKLTLKKSTSQFSESGLNARDLTTTYRNKPEGKECERFSRKPELP
jgi:hypothetical protein